MIQSEDITGRPLSLEIRCALKTYGFNMVPEQTTPTFNCGNGSAVAVGDELVNRQLFPIFKLMILNL